MIEAHSASGRLPIPLSSLAPKLASIGDIWVTILIPVEN
jgi:hypothetical protein